MMLLPLALDYAPVAVDHEEVLDHPTLSIQRRGLESADHIQWSASSCRRATEGLVS